MEKTLREQAISWVNSRNLSTQRKLVDKYFPNRTDVHSLTGREMQVIYEGEQVSSSVDDEFTKMDICRAYNAGKENMGKMVREGESAFISSDAYFDNEFPDYNEAAAIKRRTQKEQDKVLIGELLEALGKADSLIKIYCQCKRDDGSAAGGIIHKVKSAIEKASKHLGN